MSEIHSTAIIGKNVKIAESAKIGAYAIIEDEVEVGANTVIEPHARLCTGAKIGANCVIASFCVIAGLPQDLSFDKTKKTFVEVGDNCTIREGSTINRATKDGGATRIGKGSYFMANTHIGHDCQVGENVIIAPFTALGGHVTVGDACFISAGCMIQQFSAVGKGVMFSGDTSATVDVPPFVYVFGRNEACGLNLIGLVRRKTPRASIANIKELYAFVYFNGTTNARKNAHLAKEKGLATTPEGEEFINFFINAPEKKHFARPSKGSSSVNEKNSDI